MSKLTDAGTSDVGKIEYKMDSSAFNSIMGQIGTELNGLYEKIRMLDDLEQFCRNYVMDKIADKQKEFTEKLKVIEGLADSYTDRDYVVQLVPFERDGQAVTDAGGDIIPSMEIDDGRIIAAYDEISIACIDTVTCSSDYGYYSNTAGNLAYGSASRSVYYTDEPVHGGITETYTVTFTKPAIINYIDIDTANCSVEGISVIGPDGNSTAVDISNNYIDETEATGITVAVNASNYESSTNACTDNLPAGITASGNIADCKDFAEAEKALGSKQRESSLGLYRGKYTKWKEATDRVADKMALSSDTTGTLYASITANRKLDSGAIVCTDGSVIEQVTSTGYIYTPSGEIERTEEYGNTMYETETAPAPETAPVACFKTGYTYSFGIDSIECRRVAVKAKSGFISDSMELGRCRYIRVSADADANDSDVYYYIMDGTSETEIIPDDMNNYYPENSSIRIKAVQETGERPAVINSLAIRKYGTDIRWTYLD